MPPFPSMQCYMAQSLHLKTRYLSLHWAPTLLYYHIAGYSQSSSGVLCHHYPGPNAQLSPVTTDNGCTPCTPPVTSDNPAPESYPGWYRLQYPLVSRCKLYEIFYSSPLWCQAFVTIIVGSLCSWEMRRVTYTMLSHHLKDKPYEVVGAWDGGAP